MCDNVKRAKELRQEAFDEAFEIGQALCVFFEQVYVKNG